MKVFDDIRLNWKGQDYVIPSDAMLGAIARIEQHITMVELQDYTERGTAPLARLSQAYGAVLRFAGAKVADDEVYAGIYRGGEETRKAVLSLQVLLHMMLPASAMRKEHSRGNRRKAAARLSRRVSSLRSARAGSAGPSSGP
jgi:hypothetical protein